MKFNPVKFRIFWERSSKENIVLERGRWVSECGDYAIRCFYSDFLQDSYWECFHDYHKSRHIGSYISFAKIHDLESAIEQCEEHQHELFLEKI